jgi:hypothetical protein
LLQEKRAIVRKKPRDKDRAAKFRILGEDRSIKGATSLLQRSRIIARKKSQPIAIC